jgi:bla regulator protein blaR1
MTSGVLVAVANHLWQSTLFGSAVWLVTLLLRSNAASLRHRLWLAASVKFLVPFSILVGLGAQFPLRTARVAAPRQISVMVNPISTPLRMLNGAVEMPLQPLQTPSGHLPTALAALWFCGFAGCVGSFMRWKQLRRTLGRGVPLNLDIPVRTVSSSERIEPGVFGAFGQYCCCRKG